jgi:hypothetical protein
VSRAGGATAVAWVVGAGALGFAVSAVFSSVLRFSRAPFVLVHAIVVGVFAILFFRRVAAPTSTPTGRGPAAALAVGLLLGAVLVAGVVVGPGGARPTGSRLIAALAWYGFVYGGVDALLLTVIPVLAIDARGVPPARPLPRLRRGVVAFAASLLVTALYHAGFAEYRSAALFQPLIGNAVVTTGYLLTGSPVTPLLAHVLMHGAAVIHGMEATAQLPPHY